MVLVAAAVAVLEEEVIRGEEHDVPVEMVAISLSSAEDVRKK